MLSILLSQDMHFSFYLPIKIFVCNFIQYNRNFNSFFSSLLFIHSFSFVQRCDLVQTYC
jgi:hypothetical protein